MRSQIANLVYSGDATEEFNLMIRIASLVIFF